MNSGSFNSRFDDIVPILNKILLKNKICYSNIDESILRKSQEYEQMYYNIEFEQLPNSNLNILDSEILKTLDSGSSWMK